MVSTEEILITMMGKDEVTPVVNNIQGNVNSTFNNMAQSASASASSIGQAYQSVFDQIGRGLSSLNQGMMGISSVSNMVLGELGGTKSAMEYVYGTASVEQTNKVLMKSWADTKTSYEELYDTVDNVTDNSLTSMQELIPAMNAFRASTGATGQQLKDDVTEPMAQFGAYVLALTGSQQLAKTAMTDLSKGLVGKGSFNALDQYGVTRASLEARGWSGKNEDIKGYMDAIRDVSGQVEELMDTSQGVDALMGKMWSRAGKRIGREALPFVVDLKNAFMDLDDEMDGDLSTSILRVALYIEEAQKKLYMFNTLWDGVKNISEAFNTLKGILGLTTVEQEANNMMQEENNRLVQESNLALMENNELRLANAEAMGLQNIQSEGYMPYSDAMGYNQMPTEEEGGWGSDVLANTAGGLLEDRYNRAMYEKSQDNNISIDKYQKLFGDVHPSDEVVGKTSFLDDRYYRELFQSKVSSKGKIEFPQTFDSKFLSDVEDEIQIRDEVTNRLKYVSSRGEELAQEVTGMTNLGMHGQSFIQRSNQTSAVADNILKEITPDIDTGDLEEKTAGPFRRLHTFFTNKEKREFSLFDDMVKSDKRSRAKTRLSFKEFKGSFKDLKTNISDLKGETKIDTVDNIWDGLKNTFSKLRGGTEEVVEDATSVGTASSKLATTAPMMEAGAVGAETTAVAETTLAGAFTSMLYPTLAIAGVIAIMIPIVAGLVVEALFFIQLIGQFMSSLDFDFNLDGVAEKFQELGTAIAWLGVAMASLTFTGIMTGLAYIYTGFGNVKAVLGTAVGMLRDVVGILNQFQYEAQIDPNVATSLSNLGTALNGVSSALLSLVGVQLVSNIGNVLTGFGFLGSLTGTLRQAQKDLQEAIDVINQMDFTGIDETKVNTIKTTLEAISAFCDAFSGLNDIRNTNDIGNFTSWLLNGGILGGQGVTIEQAFNSAKEDIERASRALSKFDGSKIKTPNEDTVNKLKSVSEAISSVAESINSLRTLRDSYNWDDWVGGIFGGKDITTIFTQVRKDLVSVSEEIAKFNGEGGLAKVPKGLATKITNISKVISGISTAISNIQDIPTVKATDIGPKIRQAVRSVQLASNGLGQLNIDENINESLGTKLGNITTGVSGLSSVIQGVMNIPMVDPETVKKRVDDAVTSVKSTITSLQGLNGQSVSVDISGALEQVNNALSQLKTTLNNTSFSAQGRHIGNSLKSGVTVGMNGLNAKIKGQLTNGVNHSGAFALGKRMGTSLTNGFKASLRLGEAITSQLSQIDLSGWLDGALGGLISNGEDNEENRGSLYMEGESVRRYTNLNNNPKSTVSRVNGLNDMGSSSTLGNTQKNVSINIGEGAIQLDARNMTTKESRQIMINALEGLSAVNNVDVNGA